jgi:ATP-dependent phosphofructokinase / diphosphate-dependent phosphofructokinase
VNERKNMKKGNALVGQSGGLNAVINTSLAGIIKASKNSSFIGEIFGMNYGIEGLMNEWLYDLGAQPKKIIDGLRYTPSSALGSSRYKVKEKDPQVQQDLKEFLIKP